MIKQIKKPGKKESGSGIAEQLYFFNIAANFLKVSNGPLSANRLAIHGGRLPPGSASNV
jgi:hypothetical protein